jgi:hypothetical protein
MAKETLVPIGEHPAVVAAEAAWEPLCHERQRLERERREAHGIGAYVTEFTHEPTRHATEADLIRARLTLSRVDEQLRELRLKEIPAEDALREARRKAYEELAAAVRERQRAAVAKLDAALVAAKKANAEVAALDALAQQQLGNVGVMFAWPEFADETPVAASRLTTWRRFCASEGVL